MRGFVNHVWLMGMLGLAALGVVAALVIPNVAHFRLRRLAPRALELVRAARTDDGASLEEAIVAVEASRGVPGARVAWQPDLAASNGYAGRVMVEALVTDTQGAERDRFTWAATPGDGRVFPWSEATSDLLYRHRLLRLERR